MITRDSHQRLAGNCTYVTSSHLNYLTMKLPYMSFETVYSEVPLQLEFSLLWLIQLSCKDGGVAGGGGGTKRLG